MSRQRKIGISVMFALGLLGIAASATRVVESVIRAGSSDFTYNFTSLAIASAGEITAAFLVICIPALPKAFEMDFSKLRSSLRFWASREKHWRSSEQDSNSHQVELKGAQSQNNNESENIGLSPVFRVQPGALMNQFEHGRIVEAGILSP